MQLPVRSPDEGRRRTVARSLGLSPRCPKGPGRRGIGGGRGSLSELTGMGTLLRPKGHLLPLARRAGRATICRPLLRLRLRLVVRIAQLIDLGPLGGLPQLLREEVIDVGGPREGREASLSVPSPRPSPACASPRSSLPPWPKQCR